MKKKQLPRRYKILLGALNVWLFIWLFLFFGFYHDIEKYQINIKFKEKRNNGKKRN